MVVIIAFPFDRAASSGDNDKKRKSSDFKTFVIL
jgi:hypothetical protein